MVCSYASSSNFSDCRQLATSLNSKFQNGKNWDFSPPEGDIINRSRRNLARKRIPWVCYSTPFTSSVKGGRHRSPQNVKICPKLCFFGHRKPTQWTHSDEIWPVNSVNVDLGSALAHQIWPWSVKGGRYSSSQIRNLPKNMVFGHRKPT